MPQEKYVVWAHGSIRFSGNAEEFKAFLVEQYEYEMEWARKRIADIKSADEAGVLDFAQRSDNWSIEVNEPFANNPRYTRGRSFLP